MINWCRQSRNQSVNENASISSVNAQDNNTSNDIDIDGDVLSYTCHYDNTDDDAVTEVNLCTSLPGAATFNTSTGELSWFVGYSANTTGNSMQIMK